MPVQDQINGIISAASQAPDADSITLEVQLPNLRRVREAARNGPVSRLSKQMLQELAGLPADDTTLLDSVAPYLRILADEFEDSLRRARSTDGGLGPGIRSMAAPAATGAARGSNNSPCRKDGDSDTRHHIRNATDLHGKDKCHETETANFSDKNNHSSSSPSTSAQPELPPNIDPVTPSTEACYAYYGHSSNLA